MVKLFTELLKMFSCLHGSEVSDVVKLKYHLHITSRKASVVPAHIVVPWPHAVDMAVEKIIQTPGAICQLAKALCQSSGRTGGVTEKIKNLDKFIHCSDLRYGN